MFLIVFSVLTPKLFPVVSLDRKGEKQVYTKMGEKLPCKGGQLRTTGELDACAMSTLAVHN